ncbi:MAG: hypothetical protein J7M26_02170, partial [Armatimonadetes bacterium]|nr:hypothetical protein [Armatimonadota bacterium]
MLPSLDPRPDAASYDKMAWRLACGGEYRYNQKRFYVLPLLPLSAAATYALVGHHPVAFHIVQAVVGALACWVTFLLGRAVGRELAGLA